MICFRCGAAYAQDEVRCPSCGQERKPLGGAASPKVSGSTGAGPYKAGEIVRGRYEIRAAVGAGPNGHVYRAFDREVEVEIAFKVLHTERLPDEAARARFIREVARAKLLVHPNVVRFFEADRDGERCFSIGQLLEGVSLRTLLEERYVKKQRFSLQEILPIATQLGAALLQAEKLRLVIGSLRPENVVILPDVLKITDVALCRAVGEAQYVRAVTNAGRGFYLAPELRAVGQAGVQVGSRADVYSLGVVLLEMVTGVEYRGEFISPHRLDSEIPEDVDAVLRRAVAEDVDRRPATVAELVADLASILRTGKSSKRAESTAVAVAPSPFNDEAGTDRVDRVEELAIARGPEAPAPAMPAPRARPEAASPAPEPPARAAASSDRASAPPRASRPAPAQDVTRRISEADLQELRARSSERSPEGTEATVQVDTASVAKELDIDVEEDEAFLADRVRGPEESAPAEPLREIVAAGPVVSTGRIEGSVGATSTLRGQPLVEPTRMPPLGDSEPNLDGSTLQEEPVLASSLVKEKRPIEVAVAATLPLQAPPIQTPLGPPKPMAPPSAPVRAEVFAASSIAPPIGPTAMGPANLGFAESRREPSFGADVMGMGGEAVRGFGTGVTQKRGFGVPVIGAIVAAIVIALAVVLSGGFGSPPPKAPASKEAEKKTEGATPVEGAKAEGAKTEGAKTEGDKAEGAKTEGDKAEGAKTEGAKTEGAKTEGAKTEGDKAAGEPADPAKTGDKTIEKPADVTGKPIKEPE